MTRVQHFFDQAISTFTYLVSGAETGLTAIIDPVLDLDCASSRLGARSAADRYFGKLFLKVPISAFVGAALDRFATKK